MFLQLLRNEICLHSIFIMESWIISGVRGDFVVSYSVNELYRGDKYQHDCAKFNPQLLMKNFASLIATTEATGLS